MDTTFWEDIKANDFALPDRHDLTTLTHQLFSYLGSPDPNLRGDIAFVILQQWITEQNLYSDAELDTMCDELLANLHKGIGESGTDSVFLRTFSIWGLAFIVQRDITHSFMSAERFTQLLEQVTIYTRGEQDLRGWVDGKGWSHATAHIASLLTSIALHPLADKSTHDHILSLIAEHMTRQVEVVYGHGEDDRMAQPIIIILEANLVELSTLQKWLKKLEAVMDLASAGMPFDIKIFNAYVNTRNMLRALYFPIELCMPEKPPTWDDFRPALLKAIKEVGLC